MKATIYAPYTTSLFLLGWAVGGLILGALGDRYGRARMLTVCVLLYSLFTALGAFSTSFLDFCIYRFLTGAGVGGVFGLAVALIADSVPDRARPPALGLLQSLSTWGNMLAGALGMAIGALGVRQLLPLDLQPWQAIFLVGALPAFLCVFVLHRLPEPPAWVAARAQSARAGLKFGSYRELLGDRQWASRAWFGLVLCSAGIIGIWGIGNFHPKIVGSIVSDHFLAQGLSAPALASEQAYWRSLALVLQNVGGFLGMLVFAWVAQAWGRRPAFAGALLLSFGATLLVFHSLRSFEQVFWMLPLMGFGQMAVSSVYAIYLPELFPIGLRSTGVSFCYNGGRVIAATAPFTISRITASLGGDIEGFRAAGMWVSLLLLAGVAVLPFLPETRNRPMPI